MCSDQCSSRSAETKIEETSGGLGEILISWGHGEVDANERFVTDMILPPSPNTLQRVTLEEDETDP